LAGRGRAAFLIYKCQVRWLLRIKVNQLFVAGGETEISLIRGGAIVLARMPVHHNDTFVMEIHLE
jgi:hypothetical protein